MSVADEEPALLGLAPVAPDRTVAYGPHPDQIVDLYVPRAADGARAEAAGGPLVVLLHGGFWRAAYDRRHLSPLAADLAGRGCRSRSPSTAGSVRAAGRRRRSRT